jgi:single-strand DNA-binding protein
MVNNITVSGRVVTDMSQRQTFTGTIVTSFRIVHDSTRKSLYLDVDVWGKEAEQIGNRISKGSEVIIHGRLTQDSWVSKSGQKRSKYKVTANRVISINNEQEEEKEEE